jgi:hypothetical protein
LPLTPDERSLIDEIDQQIAGLQMQRVGGLNLALRTRKIREGQWDYCAGTGLLTRIDNQATPSGKAALEPPNLIQRALSAREANDAELAIELAEEAIAGGNRCSLLYATKAACLGDLERRAEAIQICDEALKSCSADDAAGLKHERGFQRILSGDYGGWSDWEHRVQRKEIAQNLAKVWPGLKEWDGSSDRTVLVCAEKGLGDTILFARYLSILRERNCVIQFLASKASTPMAAALRAAPGVYGAYSGEDQIPAVCEAWITLESLPLFADGIPAPFVFGSLPTWEPARDGRKLRVGLCWHGHPEYSASKSRRPEDLKFWEPVISTKNVEFVSLQLGEQGPCAMPMAADNTLAQTLDTICACDLVISTDTSVVHMAASLGCPTWMPMHRLNYWPWIKDGESKTPWYPSLRIFRQQNKSGWGAVFHRIAAELRSLLAG